MSTVLDIVKAEVELTNEAIRRDMPKDQGTAAQSLRVDVVGGEVRSIGSSYIEYLDRGSAPWKNPGNYKKLGYILELSGWGDRKNVSPYAAAYSIAHDGSLIYQGRKKGIELDVKLDRLKQSLSEKIPKFVRTEILNKIKQR